MQTALRFLQDVAILSLARCDSESLFGMSGLCFRSREPSCYFHVAPTTKTFINFKLMFYSGKQICLIIGWRVERESARLEIGEICEEIRFLIRSNLIKTIVLVNFLSLLKGDSHRM